MRPTANWAASIVSHNIRVQRAVKRVFLPPLRLVTLTRFPSSPFQQSGSDVGAHADGHGDGVPDAAQHDHLGRRHAHHAADQDARAAVIALRRRFQLKPTVRPQPSDAS
jgi:hypothetical protein